MSKYKKVKIDYKKIGQRIRKRRLDLGLTQEQASEKIDISSKYWSNIETSNIESIGFQTLCLIADILETDIYYLLSDNNEKIVYDEIESIFNKMTLKQRNLTTDIAKLILEKEEEYE